MQLHERVSIRNALRKHRMLLPQQTLPEPLYQFEGKQEELSSFVFALAEGEVVLVKTGTAQALAAVWKQVSSFRRDSYAASLLPVKANQERDGVLIYRDGYWAETLLRSVGILKAEHRPTLTTVFTGLGGFSRLYLFQVPSNFGDGLRAVVVKFDRPDRLAREWTAIGRLRSSNLQAREMLLPVHANNPEDSLIVSDIYQSLTPSSEVVQFDSFLRTHLPVNAVLVGQSLRCLEMFLQVLYRGAHIDNGLRRWQAFYPELATPKAVPTIMAVVTPFAATLRPTTLFYPEGLPFVGGFANPLHDLQNQLAVPTGRLRTGPIHGDLQTSNVLVAYDGGPRPLEIAVIDFEKFDFDAPLITDVVRFEADFWRSVAGSDQLTDAFFSHRAPSDQPIAVLTGIVVALDMAEERHSRISIRDSDLLAFVSCLHKLISQWRRMAAKLLDVERLPASYFIALRLYYLESLLRPMTAKNVMRSKIAFLCASLAFTSATTLSMSTAPFESPREDGIDKHLALLEQEQQKSTKQGPLWKPAIIKSCTYNFARVEPDALHLKPAAISFAKSFTSLVNDERLAEISGRLNASAFKTTKWMGSEQEKIVRNSAHAERNPNTIMLIKAPIFGKVKPRASDYVGFTHLLPLTIEGYDRYVRGEEPDNELTGDSICKPGQRAHALLFFSLALDPSSVKRLYGFGRRRGMAPDSRDDLWAKLTARLLQTAAFHIVTLMKAQDRLTSVKLIVQIEQNETIAALCDTLRLKLSNTVTADQLPVRSTICQLVNQEG